MEASDREASVHCGSTGVSHETMPPMWFPYSLPVRWKGESKGDSINESLADQTPREFLVGFYLHNPVTREWEVELHLKEAHWTQTNYQGQPLSIGWYPNEHERLAEIIYRVHEPRAVDAVRRCYVHVSKTLSCWAAMHGRGFAVGGFRVADLRHDARWRVLPHRPSVQSFSVPHIEALPERYCTIATLYREARNSPSDIYRLLCCYKILETWAGHSHLFDSIETQAAMTETEVPRDQRVDQEMLVLSGLIRYQPDLDGCSFIELPDRFSRWREWALQYVTGNGLAEPLDNYDRRFELASVANLADLAVHRILVEAMKNWKLMVSGETVNS